MNMKVVCWFGKKIVFLILQLIRFDDLFLFMFIKYNLITYECDIFCRCLIPEMYYLNGFARYAFRRVKQHNKILFLKCNIENSSLALHLP